MGENVCASQLEKCWYNRTNVLKGLVRCLNVLLSLSVIEPKCVKKNKTKTTKNKNKKPQDKLKCLGMDSAYSMSVHSCKLGAAFGLQFCKLSDPCLGPQKPHVLLKSMHVDMLRKDDYSSCAYFHADFIFAFLLSFDYLFLFLSHRSCFCFCLFISFFCFCLFIPHFLFLSLHLPLLFLSLHSMFSVSVS